MTTCRTISPQFIKAAIKSHLQGSDHSKPIALEPGASRKFLVELSASRKANSPTKVKVTENPNLKDLIDIKQSGLEILKDWDGFSDLDKAIGGELGNFPDYAAAEGRVDYLKLYHALGGDLSAGTVVYDGYSPASLAAAKDQLQVLKFLQSIGINLNEPDQGAHTPLERAKESELISKPARSSIGHLSKLVAKASNQ